MHDTPRPPINRMLLTVTAVVLVLYFGACALAGWAIGASPPGWYEGKFLAFPVYLCGLLCAGLLLIATIMGILDLRRHRAAGFAGRPWDWLPIGAALGAVGLLGSSPWYPWGLGVIYLVADLRGG